MSAETAATSRGATPQSDADSQSAASRLVGTHGLTAAARKARPFAILRVRKPTFRIKGLSYAAF